MVRPSVKDIQVDRSPVLEVVANILDLHFRYSLIIRPSVRYMQMDPLYLIFVHALYCSHKLLDLKKLSNSYVIDILNR